MPNRIDFNILKSLTKREALLDETMVRGLELLLGEYEMLRGALDAASIVAFTDAKGVITHVNNSFCRISGYSQDELIGSTHRIVNSGVHSPEFFRELWRTIGTGHVWRGEICNRKKDGTLYWVDSTIVPFAKEGPYRSRYVAIRNDITEKKLAEKELEEDRARLIYAEKMASLGELTAGISHELGNPVAAIQGRAEMLQMMAERNPAEAAQYAMKTAETIIGLTNRMSGIMQSMLSFSRDATNDPFLRISLEPLLLNLLEFGKEKLRRREIDAQIEPFTSEILFSARETQVMQILVNLLNNASDAVQSLPERWIRIAGELKNGTVYISVTDSGRGIPAAVRAKMFAPFFSTKEKGRGTGLGLNISRKLAAQHGGELFIDADCPNTRFMLALPQQQEKS